MIAATMPLLTIHHKTEYRYAHPVAFGEHRIMLRPRDGHDLRVRSSRLRIMPEPMSLRWIHDVFGNSVAIATFDERAETLSFGTMEPLVALLQETPVHKLLPRLVETMQAGTDLRTLVAAGALANARTFGGQDYTGYHAFMALVPALAMANELPKTDQD